MASFVAASTPIEDVNLAEWNKYKELVCDEDIDSVRKMGVMLRIASALDRGLSSVVKGVNCDILGDSVIMKTIVTIDASIEIREALKSSQDFKKVYKKTLEVL